MGKVKNRTHKATAKRFSISATGKLMHKKQGNNSHLKVNKSRSTLRRQDGTVSLSSIKETKKLTNLILS